MGAFRRLGTAPLFVPLLLGLAAALVLQSTGDANPVLSFQFWADLGTLVLLGGATLSAVLLGVWGLRTYARRRLQRATADVKTEALQARRRFLGRLDHELKNPLTALRAELAYLSDGDDSPQVLHDMASQVERLGRLVADLRKLAALEEQVIERQPVAIEDLLAEVMEAAQDHPGYPERRVHLTLLRRPWPLPNVLGDRGLLWLACYNLLDNALKFTSPGAEIEARAFEASPWLVVEVADDGPGIPGDDLPHVFEELYRGANARGHPGSGLGLALVRAVATLHVGTVAVRSRPGQGTVFTMRLPVAP